MRYRSLEPWSHQFFNLLITNWQNLTGRIQHSYTESPKVRGTLTHVSYLNLERFPWPLWLLTCGTVPDLLSIPLRNLSRKSGYVRLSSSLGLLRLVRDWFGRLESSVRCVFGFIRWSTRDLTVRLTCVWSPLFRFRQSFLTSLIVVVFVSEKKSDHVSGRVCSLWWNLFFSSFHFSLLTS